MLLFSSIITYLCLHQFKMYFNLLCHGTVTFVDDLMMHHCKGFVFIYVHWHYPAERNACSAYAGCMLSLGAVVLAVVDFPILVPCRLLVEYRQKSQLQGNVKSSVTGKRTKTDIHLTMIAMTAPTRYL